MPDPFTRACGMIWKQIFGASCGTRDLPPFPPSPDAPPKPPRLRPLRRVSEEEGRMTNWLQVR